VVYGLYEIAPFAMSDLCGHSLTATLFKYDFSYMGSHAAVGIEVAANVRSVCNN